MTKYENAIGDLIIVADDIGNGYIIFDRHDMAPRIEMYEEETLQKYIDSGYVKSKDNDDKTLVGACTCKTRILESNRIKVRDYFECPKCGKIMTRNDLVN